MILDSYWFVGFYKDVVGLYNICVFSILLRQSEIC